MIETSGVIEKEQGNGFYLVTLEQPAGHQCLCRAAGKLTKFRIKLLAGDKVLLQSAVAGEDQQPLAVGIESPRGVHLGHINKVAQATPPASLLRRELTQNPEGLVQKQRRQVSLRFRASSTG